MQERTPGYERTPIGKDSTTWKHMYKFVLSFMYERMQVELDITQWKNLYFHKRSHERIFIHGIERPQVWKELQEREGHHGVKVYIPRKGRFAVTKITYLYERRKWSSVLDYEEKYQTNIQSFCFISFTLAKFCRNVGKIRIFWRTSVRKTAYRIWLNYFVLLK